MTRHLAALTALAALALPGVALAQEDAIARAAEVYRLAAWPAPGPARAGVAPQGVRAPGWVADGYTVHPARGEGTLRLVHAESKAEVALSARVLETPAAARAALLRRLGAGQRPLEPVPGVGEVAFGAAVDGRLVLVHAVRGNVLMEVRSLLRVAGERERVPADDGLRGLALALDQLVLAARPLEPGQAAGPRLLGVRVAPARAGAPARVDLDLDPAGPAADHVLFESLDDVAVVDVGGHWELLAPAAGTVRLTVWVASKDLWAARAEVTVEVR
ncbi:MAG: hypothetical protein M9894_08325 [Planctomycetes bacterium]|nr:hypothetical protein [Planctomycetota bacterium]